MKSNGLLNIGAFLDAVEVSTSSEIKDIHLAASTQAELELVSIATLQDMDDAPDDIDADTTISMDEAKLNMWPSKCPVVLTPPKTNCIYADGVCTMTVHMTNPLELNMVIHVLGALEAEDTLILLINFIRIGDSESIAIADAIERCKAKVTLYPCMVDSLSALIVCSVADETIHTTTCTILPPQIGTYAPSAAILFEIDKLAGFLNGCADKLIELGQLTSEDKKALMETNTIISVDLRGK